MRGIVKMVYRNILQRHKNTTRTQNFSPTLYHFENTVRNGLSAYLLIRWSRVRISPDPPVLLRLALRGVFISRDLSLTELVSLS